MLLLVLLISSITDPDGSGKAELIKSVVTALSKPKPGSSSDRVSGEGDEDSQLIKAAETGNVVRVVEILSKSPEKVIPYYFKTVNPKTLKA